MCGFRSPRQAVETRRAEDREALAGLDVEVAHLDYVDGQYPRGADDPARLEGELRARFADYDQVLAPAGIGGHVDHLWVRDTAIAARRPGQPLTLYGDYGYNLTHDWGESSGLAAYGILPVHFRSFALAPDEVARKRRMLDAYRSQAGAFASCPDFLEPHLLAVEWYVAVPEHPEPVEPYARPYRQAVAKA
jgi:LmbE family N-acetylglucosaminyl deacetylase